MGKYLFLALILVIVIVALFSVASKLQHSFQFENLGSILRIGFQAPSVKNQGKGSISTQAEKPSPSPAAASGGSSSKITAENKIVPPAGFNSSDLSPYYGEVTLSSVHPSSLGSTGNVSLYASYNAKTPVDVTGWTIKSNFGSLLIPQALSDYNQYGYGADSDIMLGAGARLDVYNSTSPIGKNLKINECMGYLNNTYKFTPQLQCSYVSSYDRSEVSSLPGDCQNFIQSIGSCKSPTVGQIAYFSNEPACQVVLNKLNYNGCYAQNSSSPDFYLNHWMVWMPGTWSFDQSHDRVLLLDKNGLLVDEYTY